MSNTNRVSFSPLKKTEKAPEDLYYLFDYRGYHLYTPDYINFYYSKKEIKAGRCLPQKNSNFDKNHLFLFFNKDCNLSCKYCYVDNKKQAFISFEENKEFFDYFLRINKFEEKIKVTFYSHGEPLLHFGEFKKIIQYLDRNFEGETNFSVNTNLALFDQEKLKFFEKHRIKVVTGFDSPPSYDLRFPNGKVYDRVQKWIKVLDQKKLLGGINVVVNEKHTKNFFSHYLFLSNLSSLNGSIYLNKVIAENSQYEIDFKNYIRFVLKYSEASFYFRDKIKIKTTPENCGLGFNLKYNSDYVYSCRHLVDKRQCDDKDYSLKEDKLASKKEIREFDLSCKNRISYEQKCDKCFFRYFCLPCGPVKKSNSLKEREQEKQIYKARLQTYLDFYLNKYPIYNQAQSSIQFSNFKLSFSKKEEQKTKHIRCGSVEDLNRERLDKEKINLIELDKIKKKDIDFLNSFVGKMTDEYNLFFLNQFSGLEPNFNNYISKKIS